MKIKYALLALVIWVVHFTAVAQVKPDSQLFLTIAAMDKRLFEEGFNQCQLDVIDKIVHRDLDFYHDVAGRDNKPDFMAAIKKNICSNWDRKPIRKLVEGSMKVYKLANNGEIYGAIQTADHEFYIKEPGKDLYITGFAKFTHTWILEGGQWQLIESLSFEHGAASQPTALQEKFDANFKESLFDKEERILALLKQHNIPSLGIGYINQGKLQQLRMFGETRMSSGQLVDIDTVYKVASLAKPVTAMVALKLVNSGNWELDKPIVEYYRDPDLAGAQELKSLTTRHILSHQSGLPNWRYLTQSKQLAFEFKPGTDYQYSGEGFEYLRKALEKAFNKDLNTLASELIFEPLQMHNTHFYWTDTVDKSNYAFEHDENGKPIQLVMHKQANAAANLLTTVEDYSKLMVYLLNGAGLRSSLYKEMMTNQLTDKVNNEFGLGWQLVSNLIEGEFALQHTGGDYGLKAIAFVLPESQRGLVIFTNSENGMRLWAKIIKEYFPDVGASLVAENLKR